MVKLAVARRENLDQPQQRQCDDEQWRRVREQLARLRTELATRDQKLSLELVAREALARELALARWNLELAHRTLRVMNQIDDIAARTSGAGQPTARRRSAEGIRSALRRIWTGAQWGTSFFVLDRLRRKLQCSPLF